MANLKEVRTRLSSVATTKQITSAMKMVAAAKLKKAQDAIIQIRPYANKLHEILSNVSESLESNKENIYGEQRELNKILIVVITSNKGLCGAFNTNVIKKTVEITNNKFSGQFKEGNVSFITIGKKVTDFLSKKKYNIFYSDNNILEKTNFDDVSQLAETIMNKFINKDYDKIILIYNQFKNAGVQILKQEQFLPIEIQEQDKDKITSQSEYLFEPSKDYIVNELIPRSLKIQFYRALLDSVASEHGARMTAMHKATDNATEIIKELQLQYNKLRQASITNEILEIVGGAEALKK
ncbi:MAG: ATP synthase F1 subunit gamma [Bacteroidales bacterium]|nr:ATP synthase F1 subunit gamma [Bacteroidales bacterium]